MTLMEGKDMGDMSCAALQWHCCQVRNPAARASSSPFGQETVSLLGFKSRKAGDNEYQCACLEGMWTIWAAGRAVPAGCLLWTRQS